MNVIFVDRFDTVSDLRGKKRTYKNIKAAVLAAGKFSCFDIETDKDGRMFTKLCHDDSEIETFDLCYPWTGVRLKKAICLVCGGDGIQTSGVRGKRKCIACDGTGKIAV